MGSAVNIVDGWFSYLTGRNKALARRRAEECDKCPSAVYGKYEEFLPDYSIKEVKGMKCLECGCPLSTKLRSKDEKCPLGNW